MIIVRRAAAALVPVAARPAASSSPAVLRFSTSSGDSFGDKIDSEIASFSNEKMVAAVPDGFPFEVVPPLSLKAYYLERRYRNERISVRAPGSSVDLGNGEAPFLPITVQVDKGQFEVTSYMNIRPDQVHIRKVIMKNWDSDMKDYKEYFRSRGITPKAISFMYHCLGFNQNKA